ISRRRAVRREEQIGSQPDHLLERVHLGFDSARSDIGPLQVVEGGNFILRGHQVTAEQRSLAAGIQQERKRAFRVPWCSHHVKTDVAVGEDFTGYKSKVDGDVLSQREELVAQIVQLEYLLFVPESFDRFEVLPFGSGSGQSNPARAGEQIPLGLVAMKMRVHDPGDGFDSERRKLVQDGARAEVDQHGSIAVDDRVNIAGVLEKVDAAGDFLQSWFGTQVGGAGQNDEESEPLHLRRLVKLQTNMLSFKRGFRSGRSPRTNLSVFASQGWILVGRA